ncbi:MAG: hypothetical protein KGL11_09090 [Alphaproteobacteria bacterium]|nr:hypothetical protein [Alphaproteobacteria bacterium]
MARGHSVTIVTAADAGYFDLLSDLLASLRRGLGDKLPPLSILDIGLTEVQRDDLRRDYDATIEPLGWDLPYPARSHPPNSFKVLAGRPHLPKHFPGYDIYLWIDADCWVQDADVLDLFIRGAAKGSLAIVPEIDRGYWTIHKRPKFWGQNQKAFAWAFGLREGYRYGRNAILNAGVFALKGDAPHWRLWSENYARALKRFRLGPRTYKGNISFFLSDQTSLNRAVFVQGAPATLLPAYCNWFCGKGTPMFDAKKTLVVEPHEPHRKLGIIHLAGKGMKERVWSLKTLQGGTIETRLTYSALQALAQSAKDRSKSAASR